jgi:hypothetical protein
LAEQIEIEFVALSRSAISLRTLLCFQNETVALVAVDSTEADCPSPLS